MEFIILYHLVEDKKRMGWWLQWSGAQFMVNVCGSASRGEKYFVAFLSLPVIGNNRNTFGVPQPATISSSAYEHALDSWEHSTAFRHGTNSLRASNPFLSIEQVHFRQSNLLISRGTFLLSFLSTILYSKPIYSK